MAEKFWKMQKAKDDDSAEIMFYGVIAESSSWFDDNITHKNFADDLSDLGKVSTIRVRINSPGGDLFAGNAIYNILKNHKARIVSYVDGIAASAASVVLMAGDEIVTPRNGMIMIHNPSAVARGDARDFRKMADMLDKARETMLAIYEDRTGLDRNKLINMLNSETWLPAKEAVSLGFADRIDEQAPAIAAELKGDNLVVNGCSWETKKFFATSVPEIFAAREEIMRVENVPLMSVRNEGDKQRYNIWMPIVENGIKEDKRMVFGYATIFGQKDADGHRMTREAVVNALPAYEKFRNIREQHSLKAVGTAPFLEIDDIGLLVGSHISEGAEDTWKKVLDGTLKGYSLGGWIYATKEVVIDGELCVDLVAIDIDEITLCDRPKCPGAVYHMVLNQGGKLVLCISKGGDKDTMADKNTDAQEPETGFKAAVKDVLSWIKGEGKDEVTAALGIDMSCYATKDDISGIVNSIGDLKTIVTDLAGKIEKPAASGEPQTAVASELVAPAEPVADPKASADAEVPKALEGIGAAISSLAKIAEDTASRVSQIETARGMRKSSDALGEDQSSIEAKDEALWGSCFPKTKAA